MTNLNDKEYLTFREWSSRNLNIDQSKIFSEYEKYVKETLHKNNSIGTDEITREEYINLLKQLSIIFKRRGLDDFNNINFEDDKDIERSLPLFTSKLKDIALYITNKREAIKRAKTKYSMAGSYASIEKIFYEYLLKAFTKKEYDGEFSSNISDLNLLKEMPELSGIDNFKIEVEELYDDSSYFDRDPSLPASAYFNFNEEVYAYLESMGMDLEYCEWLYNTGVTYLCADNPLLWGGEDVTSLPTSSFESYDSSISNERNRINLTNKYIGNTQYILSGGYEIPYKENIHFEISQGNNRFYWLSGKNILENDTNFIIDPIPLASTPLKHIGTAGHDYTESDILFISRDDRVSGAWLRLSTHQKHNVDMHARMDKGKTIFSFPYPGYGLSGEYLPWSGRLLSNLDRTYFYLGESERENIYNAYWNFTETDQTSTFTDVFINDTSLVDSGAKAGSYFDEADYIMLRPHNVVGEPIYKGEQEYAWLYKVISTDIPISVGENKIYWPFEKFENDILMNMITGYCEPIILSGLSMKYFKGSVASLTPSGADKIFKKDSPNSDGFVEGAWLSGKLLERPYNIDSQFNMQDGCHQPGISFKTWGGMQSTFIWTDEATPADDVFFNIKHQDDCDYLKKKKFSLFKEKPFQNRGLEYNSWQECSCRAILYSPLGHPGDIFDGYDGMADFIVTINSLSTVFSFKEWRGADNKDYTQSADFGWFKLDGEYNVEPDVGWGSGKWITNNGQTFTLSTNTLYAYFRNGMHRDDAAMNTPYLITRRSYSICKNAWVKLIYDKDNDEWISADVDTDMIINPCNIIQYDHANNLTFTLTSSSMKVEQREIPTFPSMNDYSVTIQLDQSILPEENISIPIQTIDPESTSTELLLLTSDVIEMPFYGMPPASGITMSGSFFNFPTATTTTITTTISTVITDYFKYENEPVNFVLNVHLYGWNYDDSIYDSVSLGARPIWVEASDEATDYTKQKGVGEWAGTPILVDEYNFISRPTYSNMKFYKNAYIEYNRRNSEYFIWKQKLELNIEKLEKEWCELRIDSNEVTNMSTILDGNIKDIVVSATEIPSNIIFDIKQDRPLYINYYAREGFTWNQTINNSSTSIFIPMAYEKIIEPDAPYAHLSNKHFPTFASAPHIGGLYTTKDSGGFMIPKNLGISVAISKNSRNELDAKNAKDAIVYRNLDLYASDRGLSRNGQISPVSIKRVDSSWMKSDITEGSRRGMIKHSRPFQKFTPYQTQYEADGRNSFGMIDQNRDYFSPWDDKTQWRDDINYPPDWKGVHDIEEWYNDNIVSDLKLFNWKTDMYGNEYSLFKNIQEGDSIYTKRHIRDGILKLKNDITLNKVYEHMPSILNAEKSWLVNNTQKLKDIDTWDNILMIYTSSSLLFFRINQEYETGIPYCNPDDINYIMTSNSIFGGTWTFEKEKRVTICTLMRCGNHIIPVLRNLDMRSNQIRYIFQDTNSYTDMSQWDIESIDHPVLTYNKYSNVYDVSFTMQTNNKAGMYFVTFTLKECCDHCNIINTRVFTPEA